MFHCCLCGVMVSMHDCQVWDPGYNSQLYPIIFFWIYSICHEVNPALWGQLLSWLKRKVMKSRQVNWIYDWGNCTVLATLFSVISQDSNLSILPWLSKSVVPQIYLYFIRRLSHKSWQLYFSSRTGKNTENLRYAFEKVWYVLAYDTTRWCM